MDRKHTRLSRTELYEKVWTTPILQLSQEFGLSDAGLAKLCRRHGILLPGLGYWRKRETGHDPGRVPLPPSGRPGLESIEIVASQKPADILAYLDSQEIPKISVQSDLVVTHPFALRTEKLVSRAGQDEKGLLLSRDGKASHIYVSKSSLPRALRILDAFLRACEERGYTLQWAKEGEASLCVSVLGETLQFRLSEMTSAKSHVLTAAEQKNPWGVPKWDYGATGQLRFEITNLPYFDFNIQHSWGDGKFRRLEDYLGKAIIGLGAASMVIKKDREDTLQREREWAEQARRKEEARKHHEEFERRAKVLNGFIQGWRESKVIGELLQAVELEAKKQSLDDEQHRNVESFIEWTRAYAEMLNPLARLPESVTEFLTVPKPKMYQF